MLQGGDEHEQTTQRPIVCSVQFPPGLPEQAALDLQIVCAAVRPTEEIEQIVQGCQRRVDSGGRVPATPQKALPFQNDAFRDGSTIQKQREPSYTPQVLFYRCLRALCPKSAVENARICSFVRQCPSMITLLEIKRDGSHFTARSGSHTSAKRLSVRLLRVIVTLPERLVKSFYPAKSY